MSYPNLAMMGKYQSLLPALNNNRQYANWNTGGGGYTPNQGLTGFGNTEEETNQYLKLIQQFDPNAKIVGGWEDYQPDPEKQAERRWNAYIDFDRNKRPLNVFDKQAMAKGNPMLDYIASGHDKEMANKNYKVWDDNYGWITDPRNIVDKQGQMAFSLAMMLATAGMGFAGAPAAVTAFSGMLPGASQGNYKKALIGGALGGALPMLGMPQMANSAIKNLAMMGVGRRTR